LEPEHLVCKHFVELVTDYFEGALPTHERARFEAHLAECPPCTQYLAQMRQTLRLVGRLTEESVPDEGKEELLHLFRAWKQEANSP
jgi:anti-sigma factor RsiW